MNPRSAGSDTFAPIDRLAADAREAAAQVVRSGYIESGLRFTPQDEQVFASFVRGGIGFQQLVDHFSARIAAASELGARD